MKKILFVIACAVACSLASAQFNFTFSSGAWDADRASNGYTVFNGAEDYEQSTLPPNDVVGFDDPLTTGVANGPFPAGLLHPGLTVQSNLDPTGATGNNSRGAGEEGLVAASVGFLSIVSDIVLANFFVDSFDTMFAGSGVNAVGFDMLDLLGDQTGVNVTVYDASNNLIGSTTSLADVTGANFLGMTSSVAIARINIFSTGGGAEGWDNMSTYLVPEPASMIALGLGAAVLLRRRRRKKA